MDKYKSELKILASGTLHKFEDWPNKKIPISSAGVYTIWKGGVFLYVGMSGRGLTEERIKEKLKENEKIGLFSRLNSHASGRRSGDQFNLYICDRIILITLTKEEIKKISENKISLDSYCLNMEPWACELNYY